MDIANITTAYALKIAGYAIIIWLAIQGAIISAGIEENLDEKLGQFDVKVGIGLLSLLIGYLIKPYIERLLKYIRDAFV